MVEQPVVCVCVWVGGVRMGVGGGVCIILCAITRRHDYCVHIVNETLTPSSIVCSYEQVFCSLL